MSSFFRFFFDLFFLLSFTHSFSTTTSDECQWDAAQSVIDGFSRWLTLAWKGFNPPPPRMVSPPFINPFNPWGSDDEKEKRMKPNLPQKWLLQRQYWTHYKAAVIAKRNVLLILQKYFIIINLIYFLIFR